MIFVFTNIRYLTFLNIYIFKKITSYSVLKINVIMIRIFLTPYTGLGYNKITDIVNKNLMNVLKNTLHQARYKPQSNVWHERRGSKGKSSSNRM